MYVGSHGLRVIH